MQFKILFLPLPIIKTATRAPVSQISWDMQKTLLLTNDIAQVPMLARWVEELGQELQLPLDVVFQLNLALEEAVVNVMNYAYPGEKGKPVTVTAEFIASKGGEERILFVLTDEGVPFDPTLAAEPDVTLPAEQRSIGGLGIFLVQRLMENVTYERKGRQNVLSMLYCVHHRGEAFVTENL